MEDSDIARLADPDKDQYFLTNPSKLQVILDATSIRETDHAIELGAGVGTVARVLPRAASLTLIELDDRLIPELRRNAPSYASVMRTDGVELLRRGKLDADVILGNLPHATTAQLAALLPDIQFRVGVLAAGSVSPFKKISRSIEYHALTVIQGDDFTPPQPGRSVLASVRRRQPEHSLTSISSGSLDELVRTSEAAAALSVSARSLARWAAEGLVTPPLVTPGGHMRWNVEQLRRQLGSISPER